YQEALAMRLELYPEGRSPRGHELLAAALDNVGGALSDLGRYEEALGHSKRALAMRRRSPRSPTLSAGLNNVGGILRCLGRAGEALEPHREALAEDRKRYPAGRSPDGHRDIALSLTACGLALHDQGRAGPALGHFGQALAMQRRLLVRLSADAGAVA